MDIPQLRVALAMIALTFGSAGCNLLKGLPESTQNIEDATKNIDKAADSLGQGLDKLDPLALKTVLNENNSLRAKLEVLGARLAAAPGGEGLQVLAERRVLIRVTPQLGEVRVVGWVDTEENEFTRQNVAVQQSDLPITYNAARNGIAQVDWQREYVHIGSVSTPTGRFIAAKDTLEAKAEVIDARYKTRVEEKYDAFRNNPSLVHTNPIELDVHQRFNGRAGKHVIVVRIKRVSRSASAKVECVIKGPNNSIEIPYQAVIGDGDLRDGEESVLITLNVQTSS